MATTTAARKSEPSKSDVAADASARSPKNVSPVVSPPSGVTQRVQPEGFGSPADASRVRLCRACRHPQRGAIDLALANGSALRQVASAYGLSRSGLHRHQTDCLPAKIARANADRVERVEASDLFEKMAALNDKSEALLEAAIESKAKVADQARIIREVRENLALMGRFLGAFAGENAKVVDNRTQIVALREMSVDELRLLTAALRSRSSDAD